MNAEILCVGTELLLGDIVNTNAAWLSRELAACGVGCYYQSVVGDNALRLGESLRLALSRADIVITTGGLGPTCDDLTKETVAAHFNLGMELHQPSLDRMTAFFRRIGRIPSKNNEKQALMPKGAIIFENGRGTAPGLAVEGGGKTVIMLPGPPSEMTAMFTKHVRPFLQSRSGRVLRSRTVHLFGIGESAVEDALSSSMLERQNPTVAPYAKAGEVQLRVTAAAENEQAANALAAPVVEEILAIFPQHVYGVDVNDLQTALARALKDRGKTIAVAESCTGGMIASRLTEIPGVSKVFLCGVCSYSNQSKTAVLGVDKDLLAVHGAVSEEVALAMARGVRRISGAEIGLSTTGVAGPDGGSAEKPVGLVFVGFSAPWGERALRLSLSRGYEDERQAIRNSASLHAMNLALREVLD